jgi:hypothetical protein
MPMGWVEAKKMDRIGSTTTKPTRDDEFTCRDGDSSEDAEATRQAKDREARDRLDQIISHSPPHVVGQSDAHAACSTLTATPVTPDWTPTQKAVAWTRTVDKPLEDDPAGNAIIAGMGGGAIAGVEAASATNTERAALLIANARAGTAPAAEATASKIVGAAAKGLVKDALKDIGKHAAWGTLQQAQEGPEQPAPLPDATPEDRSVDGGVCAPPREVESRQPPGPDRVPYPPGKAPPVACSIPLRC